MGSEATVLFTCCGGSGGWSIARSLAAREHYRLIGVDTDHLSAGLYTEAIDASYVVPGGDAPEYRERILDIVRRESVDVVLPISDEEVIALAPYHEEFAAAGAKVITAPPGVIEWVVDKLKVVHAVAGAGVCVPASCGLDDDFSNIPMPVIVRPRTGRGGHGVCFFDTLDELRRYRDYLGDKAGEQFVQEKIVFFPGNLYMAQAIFDEDQRQYARFASRSIKTMHDWGGPALGGIPVRSAELDEIAANVFAATGPWYGPVNTEFLYDPDRREFVFLEVNPRYWGYSYLATAAGLNFPDITVRLALGEKPAPSFDYSLDVFTLTSREQISIPRARLQGPIPGGDLP